MDEYQQTIKFSIIVPFYNVEKYIAARYGNPSFKAVDVATPDSKIRLLVIPTNEELMIAKDTYELCK